jgi:hypothetical protein
MKDRHEAPRRGATSGSDDEKDPEIRIDRKREITPRKANILNMDFTFQAIAKYFTARYIRCDYIIL